jgi:S-adenosylmethionine:tRNA-ribosyltransferase-isomerase (queuine synthetase)
MNYKKSGKKLLAVGTTVCRTLESLPHLWKELTEKEKLYFSHEVQAYWNTLID